MPDDTFKSAILDWVERRLLSREEFFLPIKRLYRELPPELADPPPPPEALQGWLEADARFEILRAADSLGVATDEESAEETEAMEKLGYFQGPRVGLQSKRPSRDQVLQIIQKHAGKLIDSLQKAYEARPRDGSDSQEIEDQLLELMKRAKTLQEQIPGVAEENSR
jgi:hypothetical protein